MRGRVRVERVNGVGFVRLKSGRRVGFWDTIKDARAAESALNVAVGRSVALADEYGLGVLDRLADDLEDYVGAVRHGIEERRAALARVEKIERLRNTTGRTPQEARAFRAKADEMERAR